VPDAEIGEKGNKKPRHPPAPLNLVFPYLTGVPKKRRGSMFTLFFNQQFYSVKFM